ncbi:MAG: hypothetical protein QG669_545 [Patescibacteria group bacterium]|jgi:(p)ppGpp synthase/HD superfamily hydrolase|nr:hypothetical protein [Patescibacteria group bacterium]MDQ5962152.1 hypothetical protein [Patescibacteria group bacterium]
MRYNSKIQKAIELAIQTHELDQKQKRKGKDIPYVTHPLTVGLILSLAGANDDLVIAGLLHDTIEDSIEEKKVTKEMITEQFGNNVMQLVLSVTEQDKTLSWEVRKAEALEHIKTFSHDSLMLKSADLISNTREIISDYEKEGDEMFIKFNAPKEKIIGAYTNAMSAILEKWSDNPLSSDLNDLVKKFNSMQRPETDFYLTSEELKEKHIVYVACEDEENCGFLVEFKYPNCTFFFCKEDKMGFNIDLNTVAEDGVLCKQHGEMERYNVLIEDNVCPSCNKYTMSVLSAKN